MRSRIAVLLLAFLSQSCGEGAPHSRGSCFSGEIVARGSENATYLPSSSGDAGRLIVANGVVALEPPRRRYIWTTRNQRLMAGWRSADDVIFAVGADATTTPRRTLALRCGDEQCERLETPFEGQLLGVHGTGLNEVVAVGVDAQGCSLVLRYDGSQWSKQPTPACATLQAVWAASSKDVWASGTVWTEGDEPFGRIFHFNGVEWSVALDRVGTGLQSMTGGDAANVYASGFRDGPSLPGRPSGIVLRFDGSAWTERLRSDDVGYTSMALDAENTLWLGGMKWGRDDPEIELSLIRFHDEKQESVALCGFESPSNGIYLASGCPAVGLTREGQVLSLTDAGAALGCDTSTVAK